MKKLLEKSEMIFAVILLVSFFLPWIGSYTIYRGYTAPIVLMAFPAYFTQSAYFPLALKILTFLFLLIYLIPISSGVVIYRIIRKKRTLVYSIIAGGLVYLLLTYTLITYSGFIINTMHFGGWLTLISALGLIVSAILSNKYKNFEIIESNPIK